MSALLMPGGALAPLFAPALAQRLAAELGTHGWSHASGGEVAAARAFASPTEWAAFADCWNRLTLDRYMGDGGTYRYRRYSQFMLADPGAPLVRMAHGPYEQPAYINGLNGGIERHFDPLEDGFVGNALFDSLLRALAQVFNDTAGETVNWNIRLHPYRIVAQEGVPGNPTPEGLHRDGVDYIVSMMVRRHNVSGARTTVTDNAGSVLAQLTLAEPLEMLLGDDARTMHAVSPVRREDNAREAWRDVLVIAYTRA
jgi:hypothetical protein